MNLLASSTRRQFLRTAAIALPSCPFFLQSLRAADSPRLKAAVIGHTGQGDYGHGLDGIFLNRPNIDLVALADADPDGRAKIAAKNKVSRTYADYRELLDKERPDLVSVAMRHASLHHDIVLAALRAGAHVYCEKPFVTTPAEADELLAEAAKRSRRMAVAHTLRLLPAIVRFKQAVTEGLLGNVIELRAHGKQDTRAGGEDMMVLGTHLFDLLRLFAGDPISCTARVLWQGRDLVASDGRRVKDDVGVVGGDHVFAQFAFAHGVQATFTSVEGLRETTGSWGIEVVGTKAAARINCDVAPNVFLRRTTGWNAEGRTESWQPFDAAMVKGQAAANPGPVGDWLESITAQREPECSARNGAWAVEMAMAVYHAALGGRRVEFPLKVRTNPLTTT